jgi:hypothetical protein
MLQWSVLLVIDTKVPGDLKQVTHKLDDINVVLSTLPQTNGGTQPHYSVAMVGLNLTIVLLWWDSTSL